MGVMSEG